MPNVEDIKKWLKAIGKNRQWLAEQTLSSKGTVNNWLSSGKPIPSAKMDLIERLMTGEEEIQFELPENFETIIRYKAEAAKKSIDDLVIEILEMTVQEQKRKKNGNIKYPPAEEKLHPTFDDDGGPEEVNNVILREVGLPEIMVVANVAAGEVAWDDFDEPYPLFKKPVTALHVSGTSMEPEIKHGQVVLARPVPENDDLEKYIDEIVVYEGGDDVPGITLKRLVKNSAGQLLLAPVNPAFRRRCPITGKIKAYMIGKIDLTK